MKKLYSLILLLPLFCSAATYPGNGGTGFGGVIGGGNLVVFDDGVNINFQLNTGGTINDDLVIYVDNLLGGGYTSTATFTDSQDGGRTAISGYTIANGRTLLQFPAGFHAQYAISVENTFVGLFPLNDPTNFSYVTSGNLNRVGNTYYFFFPKTALGLNGAVNFNFLSSYISTTAYRSNESIGTNFTSAPPGGSAPNYGFTGTATANSYALYPAGILALSGVDFRGKAQGDQTLLQWTSANESGISSFTVEQSGDNANWVNAATEAASGNSTGNQYSIEIRNMNAPVNYYRLRINGTDGSHVYSNVLSFKTASRDGIRLINSLVQNDIAIEINSGNTDHLTARIINLEGRPVRSYSTSTGSTLLHLNAAGLISGVYFLQISRGTEHPQVFKIFKQ